MNADLTNGPDSSPQHDAVELLAAFDKASTAPIRPEYIEETAYIPSRPDDRHNDTALALIIQLHSAGVDEVGVGNGYRVADEHGASALVVPDFYVRRRRPTAQEESYSAAHGGWYPIDMIALVGEVTSTNHETDTGPKLRTYAAAGVPVYVLIDRNAKTAHCYTAPVLPGDDPTEAFYDSEVKVALGERLRLPEPYPTLDTAAFLETAV
ncbi:Uma2 family endonuclease [Streptomyces sp. R35]|uniref:Uma2 family endonuclease n=1 Tax=Streptomyces sp. R35 TaxID=3238630 RepID=A0AB39S8N7_9ACTN